MSKIKYLSSAFYLKTLLLGVSLTVSMSYASENTAPIPLDDEKALYSIRKVKEIFQTMQARELDYIAVTKAFGNKLSDSHSNLKDKFDIIDPYWLKIVKRNTKLGKKASMIEFKCKKIAIDEACQAFQKHSIEAKNAIEGFQEFIKRCDRYMESHSAETLQVLQDSFLSSHLLGLKSTIDRYISSNISHYSHVSLKMDEINTYYTQDSRLNALTECYYIVDYIRPIAILMKLGVIPSSLEWGFAENLKKYTDGSLTLDDPSIFLLDGFLYKEGIEKANKSINFLKKMEVINSSMDTGGFIERNMVEVEALTRDEKQIAINKYTEICQAYRERVDSYIRKLTFEEKENVEKSRKFLRLVLGEDSQYSLTPLSITTLTTVTTPQTSSQVHVNKPKRKRNRKKNHLPQTTQNHTELFDKKEVVILSSETEITDSTSSISTKTIIPLETDIEINSLSRKKMPEKKSLRKETTNYRDESLQMSSFSLNKLPSLIPEREGNNSKNGLSNKNKGILKRILDPKSSPFTINYLQALNAMSKIGINELQPKRKGDFRKLVRLDSNDNIIGKMFAYKPATSSLGNELMKIYREVIQQQLNDRNNIDIN